MSHRSLSILSVSSFEGKKLLVIMAIVVVTLKVDCNLTRRRSAYMRPICLMGIVYSLNYDISFVYLCGRRASIKQ